MLGQITLIITAMLLACVGTLCGDDAATGVRVWNADVLSPWRDFVPPDAGSPLESVAIVGTPGGSFSGKIVLGSIAPIRGLRAGMSGLRCGEATIPVLATQVRYARYMRYGGWNSVAKAVAVFDALDESPPEEVALITSRMKPGYWDIGDVKFDHAWQPVWVTVTVPRDATPGEYEGTLTVSAEGLKPVAVPVKLTVCGWRLPAPAEWRTFVEFIQSPESVAMRYEVPLWSEAHFARLAKSLALLGRAGNRSVYIPLICETNQGNAETMVRWVADGEHYRYDFTVMEKYLDVVEKHMGRPRNVVLYVWDIFLEGGSFEVGEDGKKTDLNFLPEEVREDRQAYQGKGPEVTLLDAATAGLSKLELPEYRDAKARALWKPLLNELRDRLKKRGLEDAVTLGAACDSVPSKETVAFFAELLPGVPWMEHTHGFYGGPQNLEKRGARIKYVAIVFFNQPSESTLAIHALKEADRAVVWYPRGRPANDPITDFRLSAELHTSGGLHGFGRVGADFWPVMKDKRGRAVGRICEGRFPKSRWRNLDIRQALLEPGDDGAVSTARFEMTIEGIQENEARLFVEGTLFEKKVDGDLAKRSREVLDERVAVLKRYRAGAVRNKGLTEGAYLEYTTSWRERSKKLYDLAADVAKAIEGR